MTGVSSYIEKVITFNLKKKERSKGGTLLKYSVAKERYIVKAVNHVYVLITFNVRPHERQYIC